MSVERDPFFHRELTLRVGDRRLVLQVSQELFSSHTIDTGTLRLTKSLERTGVPDSASVLDLGCGYGPLGLAAALLAPAGRALLVDRDALAVSYAARNAETCGLGDRVEVRGSLGYDDIGPAERFDLVVSNVPGKAPPAVHAELVAGAARHLVPGGLAAIVVVEPLTALVDEILATCGADVVVRDPANAYTVFHYRFPDPAPPASATGLDRGVYDRDVIDGVRTVWGIPEFDQLSYGTDLALGLLRSGDDDADAVHAAPPGNGDVAVVNPGQGHLAVACRPSTALLADRDLLALRTSAANLAADGVGPGAVRIHHGAFPPEIPADSIDLGILSLRPKEPRAIHVAQAGALARALRPGGRLVALGPTTAVTRLLAEVPAGLEPHRTDKARGHAAAELVRTAR